VVQVAPRTQLAQQLPFDCLQSSEQQEIKHVKNVGGMWGICDE
jgi:hypothetical protein